MSTDYGPVASTLARVIDVIDVEVVSEDTVLLETLAKHVGTYDFRRRVPTVNNVDFNLDLAGKSAEFDARIANPQNEENGLVPGEALVGTRKERITIHFPEAEESLKEAFRRCGGVRYVFVGPGFWKYLTEKGLLKDGRLGSARVIFRPRQPDRDVFLVGNVEGLITELQDLPPEKLGRVTVVSKHPSLQQKMPQVGTRAARVLSTSEQREYLNSLSDDKRNLELAKALENVSDGTAKSTLRTLFPEMPEEKMLVWFYQTLRQIRPSTVPERDFKFELPEHVKNDLNRPPLKLEGRAPTYDELMEWVNSDPPTVKSDRDDRT